jgi:hypothetical protein
VDTFSNHALKPFPSRKSYPDEGSHTWTSEFRKGDHGCLHIYSTEGVVLLLLFANVGHDIWGSQCFCIFLLERCWKEPTEIVVNRVVTLETELSYPEHLTKFMDRQDHVMRQRTIRFYDVLCSQHMERKATCETEGLPCFHHLDALPSQSKGFTLCFLRLLFLSWSRDEISFKGEGM